MNKYCIISTHKSIKIGKRCMFSPGVKIFDNTHIFNKEEGVNCGIKSDNIFIGDNCRIASDVIILIGTHIGDRCVIYASCIISGNIPDNTLVKQKEELLMSSIF